MALAVRLCMSETLHLPPQVIRKQSYVASMACGRCPMG